MKLLRPILLTVGVVSVLGVVAVGLALTPSLQRWAILRAAARQPELHLQLKTVSAGFSRANLRGVQAEHRGIKVSFDELDVEYSLWAFLSGRRLELGRLFVRGLLVDATRISFQRAQAGLAAAPAAAPGALAQIRLPYELSLGELDLQGRLLLAGATGRPALEGDFRLQGGKLAPGREGEIQWQAQVKDPTPGARVATVDARGTLLLRESPDRGFDLINLSTLLDATGPGLVGHDQLKLVAQMSRTSAGEKYRVTVEMVRGGQAESVLSLDGVHAPAGAAYTGEWALSSRSAQLESFLLGHPLPKFSANGSGRFEYVPHPAGLSLQGSLQAEVSELEKFRPELSALGVLRLKSDFDLTADSSRLRFREWTATLAGEHPVLELRTAGPLDFNLKERRLESAGAGRGEIIRLKLTALPLAWIAPFFPVADISGGPVTGELAIAQGERDQFTVLSVAPLAAEGVSVVRAGRTLLASVGIKLAAEAELSPIGSRIKLRFLEMKSAAGDSVRANLLVTAPQGFRLPLAIEGDFSAELPALLTRLLPAVPVKARGSIELNWLGDRVEVRRLIVESSDAEGKLLGALTVPRPFVFDLARGLAETSGPDEVPLANIRVGELPLVVLPRLYADYGVSGRLGPAEAALSAQGAKLMLRANAPVPVLDFSVLQRKKTMLDRLKIRLQPSLEFTDGTFTRLQTGPMTLETGGDVPLAALNAELIHGDGWLRVVSTFDFDLPAWSSQPALLGRDALSSGQLKGELRAALVGQAAQIEARATVNSLIATETDQTLPLANLNLRADIDAAGHVTVKMPVLLDRAGQRSDLDFSAEGTVASAGLSFDAKLKSEHVELRDVLLLLAVAGSPLAGDGPDSPSAQSRAISPPPADQAAFWSGAVGQVSVDCKSIVVGQDWSMTALTGRLLVQDDRLVLEKLDASFAENSKFTAQGSMVFAPGLNPYLLRGDFALTEFDAGRFFKALYPEQPPALEGLFSVNAKLAGQGLNFDDTIDRTFGSYDLTSRKGVFRGLKRSTDKISMASKAVVLVSSLLGDKSAEKITGNAFFVEQLAQELEELRFDQFTARLLRDPALNWKLESIAFISQQIHFLGSGRLTYVAGKPLLELPLEANLSLRARDKIEEILGKLKVLDGTRDELGYARTKEALTLGGTLAKPDPTPFFVRLAAGKVSDALAPESTKPGQ